MVKSMYADETRYTDASCITTTEFAHGEIVDAYFETKLDPGYRSMRPLHDICLHTELTRLAQALHALRSLGVPKRDLTTFKTDSIGFCA